MRGLEWEPNKVWERWMSRGEASVVRQGIVKNGKESPLPIDEHSSMEVVKLM